LVVESRDRPSVAAARSGAVGIHHNPWVVLQTVSREKLERALAEPAFRKNVDDLVQGQRDAAQASAWFQKTTAVCAELRGVFQYGVHAERGVAHLLGGLGNVAGDQLKAASDLGVPVIGVGLLYSQGYFAR